MTIAGDSASILQELINLPEETEWVEFKEAKNNFDFDDLGRYFSALSNEANLKDQVAGWLVFGVTDRLPRIVVGSNYRLQKPGLEKLKREISKHTNHQATFINIHELSINNRRVVLFEIPPAVRGVPTTWQGVAYGRIHDSLSPLNLQKIEHIRRQVVEDYLKRFKTATRKDFDVLLLRKLSDAQTDGQKKNFITNLLQEMRREGTIQPVSGKRGKGSKWELHKTALKDPV